METWMWIAIAGAAGLAAALLTVYWEQRRQHSSVAAGRAASEQLLGNPERMGYVQRWHDIEADFEAVPDLAVGEAHDLVHLVMLERGLPIVPEPEARPKVVSEVAPDLAEPYRRANKAYLRSKQGVVPTENLEHALVSYRSLLGELLSAA